MRWTTYSYDAMGRTTRVDLPDGSFTTYVYQGNTTISAAIPARGVLGAAACSSSVYPAAMEAEIGRRRGLRVCPQERYTEEFRHTKEFCIHV